MSNGAGTKPEPFVSDSERGRGRTLNEAINDDRVHRRVELAGHERAGVVLRIERTEVVEALADPDELHG
jgi:hypothetical protein